MNPRPLVLVFALVAGCGAASAPPAPQIGELVDTVGRPLIAAVLVSPFASADAPAAAAASWKSAGAQARASALLPALAAFDSLDGSCGNQLAAGAPGPSRYQPLAARLADDRLLIDSRAAPCERLLAVESGLAVAALTQCSAPPHLQVLGAEHGLGPLEPMQVAVVRSRASQGSKAVDMLQQMLVQTLRHAGQ